MTLLATQVITRRSLQAALQDQGFEEAFDLGTIDALLEPDMVVDFSGPSTLQLWLPGFHALLPTVSDADFSPVFMEYSKDVLDQFGYALNDADLRIRADRLLPDLQLHLKSLTDTILAVLYDKLAHGEAYISRQHNVDMPSQEIVKNLSHLFGGICLDTGTDQIRAGKELVLKTAFNLFYNISHTQTHEPSQDPFVHYADFSQMTPLERKILTLGVTKKLEQSFGGKIVKSEEDVLRAYEKLRETLGIAYGEERLLELHNDLLYLGLTEFFGNRDGITKEQRQKDLWGKIDYEREGYTRSTHDYRLTIEADLHLTRKFRLKNPFAHGGKIYLNRERGFAVIHAYSSCKEGIGLTNALKEGQEYLILVRIGQSTNSSILSSVAHAAAQGKLQELLENWTFSNRLVPTGFTGYAANPYGVARFLEDRKLQQN
ncbi:hypothetical protein HYU06_05120 [Candidatus Woesearchaeota archaeon]|nr:hypothetical protein [Candidatus Woesearchaeota archaeon]